MFDNEFPPLGGGTGVVNLHLLEEMALRPDVTVDLVTSSRTKARYETEAFADRITIYKVPVDNRNIHHATNRELLRYSWRGLRLARQLASEHQYDVSFAFAGVPAGAISYLLRLTHGLPYVLSLQGPDVPGFEARYNYLYPVLTPFITQIWRRAGVVTAISAEQVALAHRTIPDLPLITIPNGVDTNAFVPATRNSRRPFTMICVARLIERKGQHHLLQAFANLRAANHEPMALIFVGTGDAEPQLRELAAKLQVAEAVTFKGFVPRENMPPVYHDADVFVLPSQHEGMSIALLEAMASGLPVIVTDTGGTAELVTQGANGEIVPWDDVEALTTALQRLLNAAEQRRRMGDESRRRALAFGWPTLAARYLELCARVMVPSAESRAKDARSAKNVARDWTRELRG
ncbi:MAG TPA: glycosyltransferase family 4 protein [Nitrospira sp.]|nr:glycosyltransferase family 4 protein [Nitrospira sp.]HMW85748.1 glycosyltransferase family 4 protein [Nitrospira sp.]HMX92840.1 glycosyltransferase family 4 protein [Nitrospira sp.]HMZ98979.1 glycosyltransferase family 4 protein [Nitrospira sp.]HNA48852.1 glycosyltransferase family 4 protein [Nitrospira sp.]